MHSVYRDVGFPQRFNLNGISINTTTTDKLNVVDDHIFSFCSTSNSNHKTKVIGFDTEWLAHNPDASSRSSSKCSTLQLCDGHSCLIIELSHFVTVPESLVNFLGQPNYMFVGFGIKDNVAKLEKNYGFGCRNAVELAPLAATAMKRPFLSYCGVDELAYVVNKLDLGKERSLNFAFRWDESACRRGLAKIATINVYAYHKIGSKLLAQDWE